MTEKPLTTGAIEVALHDCMPGVAFDRLSATQVMRLAEDMHAALTESRPLSPDAITDEMVERALQVNSDLLASTVHRMLTAALTESPARPEGAEAIQAAFDTWENAEYLNGGIDEADKRALADHIAEEMNR